VTKAVPDNLEDCFWSSLLELAIDNNNNIVIKIIVITIVLVVATTTRGHHSTRKQAMSIFGIKVK